MVATPKTLDRFIFNSDYPTDKIVWLYEGQFTTPQTAGVTETLDIDVATMIGSKQAIYIKGAYTLDNWDTAVMLGTYPLNDISKAVGTSLNLNYLNGVTLLKLQYSAGNSAACNKTAKFRLWGVQREDIALAIDYGKTAPIMKNKLNFSTDNNYPRIYKEGIAKNGDVIQHDLGHIPYVDFWYAPKFGYVTENSLNTFWWYNPIGEFYTGTHNNATVMATDSTVTFSMMYGDTYDVYYYYRIYA